MTNCYICEDRIEEHDWVIPFETYRATYFGDDEQISLNADDTVETVIHADCLKQDIDPHPDVGGKDTDHEEIIAFIQSATETVETVSGAMRKMEEFKDHISENNDKDND